MTEFIFQAPFAGAPNEIMKCDDFFISFNAGQEMNPLDKMLCAFGQIKEENIGRAETAIVIPDSNKITGLKHLILYGDYRNAYLNVAAKGLEACLLVFTSNIEHMTDTSDSLELNLN